MLDEAQRRRARGTQVMIGCVDTHDRSVTGQRLAELNGSRTAPTDLDVDAVIDALPTVVLVDELARRNHAGARNEFRWQDVDAILDAGIDVISTLTVQQIDSLADPVREIVGRVPDALVPDEFLSRADQIELVDISPEAIRRRIAHGNVYGSDELEPADGDLFNSSAFASLRALMMFWMADRLAAGPEDPRGAREKVVVAVTDSPTTEAVLRRGARLAQRSRAALLGVHVCRPGTEDPGRRETRRRRVESLGGTYFECAGDDVARALVLFADAEHATQLVLGTSNGRWFSGVARRTVVDAVIRAAPSVDVHVVSVDGVVGHPATSDKSSNRWTDRVPGRRRLGATAGGALLLAVLTMVLAANRTQFAVSTSLALYLLAVVAITATGGALPGIVAAITAPLLANWFLIPPYHTLRISDRDNLVELIVFISVSAIVAAFVSVVARRATELERAQREVTVLAALAGSADIDQPATIVGQLRRTFGLDGVAVVSTVDDSVQHVAVSGTAPVDAATADLVAPISPDLVLLAIGPALSADDHRVLNAFVGRLSTAFEHQRLRAVAAEADALARVDELRTAILRAVSHDLRSPLAGIKASVSSLRQPDVEWPADVRDQFIESIESETDRLSSIVTNLLDLSRLEAGSLRPVLRATSLEEVVPAAVRGLGAIADGVVVDLPADLTEVSTDPALLERVVANLVSNAVAWSPDGHVARIRGYCSGQSVQLHVIDHGPGIPLQHRTTVLQPFHRLADSGAGGGLGLGLAIADRLLAAMGSSLELRDTPGGGLTAVVILPAWLSTGSGTATRTGTASGDHA
jgi:two-component system, OmpR family, sensor histidine kinase KdpD